MKKSVLVIALAFGVSSAFAQDLTSKKGEPMLPEAGDWAISMNADPIFHFVGNAFNGNTDNSAPTTNWLNSAQTIVGKKFIDDKNAYRVVVRLGLTSFTSKNMVAKDNAAAPVFPAGPEMAEDKMKESHTNIAIGVGKEMRRGKTRLQGFYGADALIWLSSEKTKYTYGNAFDVTTNATPTTTDFNSGSSYSASSRTTVSKSGLAFGIGVRGFIGAEYFIFPKISVGAEYGWGIGFQVQGKGKQSTETIGGSTPVVGTVETETSGSSAFGFDTDINSGNVFGISGGSSSQGDASLKVIFHF